MLKVRVPKLTCPRPTAKMGKASMALTGALAIILALSAGAGGERLLLCRPKVAGDPAMARADTVVEAARKLEGRFLDYGVPCEDGGEGARAARRAGLDHAVTATAEGRGGGSRFELVLTDAGSESVRARRALEVAPGQDAVRPLRAAFEGLLTALPPPPGPRPAHVAGWSVAGVGVAALVAGTVLAFEARSAASRANRAGEPAAFTHARADWKEKRKWSGVAFGAGGGLVAAGLVLRVAF